MTTAPPFPIRASAANRHRKVGMLAALVLLTACDSHDGRELPPAKPGQNASVLTTTTAAATTAPIAEVDPASIEPFDGALSLVLPWNDNAEIPAEFTCAGAPNVAPRLTWGDVPEGTVELAVVMTDSDSGFVNWVMSGISVAFGSVEAGVVPPGAVVSLNGSGAAAYAGPCPSEGTHSYVVQLFAVDQQLELTDQTPPAEAVQAIEAASLDVSAVAGVVTR